MLIPLGRSLQRVAADALPHNQFSGVTGMLATVIADYVIPEHRGRMVGLTGMFNGLGTTPFISLRRRRDSFLRPIMGIDPRSPRV